MGNSNYWLVHYSSGLDKNQLADAMNNFWKVFAEKLDIVLTDFKKMYDERFCPDYIQQERRYLTADLIRFSFESL